MKTVLNIFRSLALLAIFIVVATFLITRVWGWVVPDVFSGMVEGGLLPEKLSLSQAFKLIILFGILGLTGSETCNE